MNFFDSFRLENKFDSAWKEVIRQDQLYFPFPWTLDDWRDLDLSLNHLLIFLDQQKVVGHGLFFYVPGDEVVHLQKICVLPELRGKGIAEIFWMQVKEYFLKFSVTSIYLEVQESNIPAVSFYRKVGFRELRNIKNFYSTGENGLIMTVTL
jgi:ribosomal-protein-alanine N-acetyltransferase